MKFLKKKERDVIQKPIHKIHAFKDVQAATILKGYIYEFDHGLHGVIKTVCTSCHGWTRRKIKKAERYWIRGLYLNCIRTVDDDNLGWWVHTHSMTS